ncbi:hypothetical protein F2Q69_00048871 [Brassica cretica]|uniref:DUF4283 domain-containing protein n=1 Tax=Brassica cretica TaxID=69181 RepID=A0A8S9Q6F3_BRACR|nr:hypothetical protein F2Q69_00048871 [Brassica cretica]
MRHFAPVTMAPSGRPRVLISDTVFQKEAELDKDFIICYFNAHSKSTPPLKAIKIWAHLTGVPLDLRHDEGMSLVAGLIGEPREMDDFTKNLKSQFTILGSTDLLSLSRARSYCEKLPTAPPSGSLHALSVVPLPSLSHPMPIVHVSVSNRTLLNTLASNPFITPEHVPRPSLKRSRSSRTLSPPLSSNTNPNLFAQSLALLNPVISHKTNLNTSYVPLFQLAFPSASQDSSILSEDPPLLS